MKVKEAASLLGAEFAALCDENREITGGVVGDLLSVIMAQGKPGLAWITVQTHLNVIAVAALHEFACVLLPIGAKMEQSTLDKAREQGVNVLYCPQAAFALAGVLAKAGI